MVVPFRVFLTQRLANLFPVAKLFLVWVLIGVLGAIITQNFAVSSLLYVGRITLYVVFGWWVEFQLAQKKITQQIILACFSFAGVLIAYFGLLQYGLLPDTRFLVFLGWDDHYYRLVSTLLDPGFTGIVLVLSALFLQRWFMGLEKQFQGHWLYRSILGIGLVSLVSALLLTYSRASYLAFGAMELGFWLVYARAKLSRLSMLVIIPLVLVAGIFVSLPNPGGEGHNLFRTSTVWARIEAGQTSLKQLKTWQVVTGQGIFTPVSNTESNFLAVQNHALIPDNWILFLLQGTGVVGLGLASLWFIQVMLRQRASNPLLLVGTVTLLVHAFFAASIVYPFVVIWLIGLRFMGMAAREK
jgi:hypothetical protein